MKIGLITGITGQDGSYLSELLLDKEYKVWGIIRKASSINTNRIEHLYHNKNLVHNLIYTNEEGTKGLFFPFLQISLSLFPLVQPLFRQ